jgi:hypothetical protein
MIQHRSDKPPRDDGGPSTRGQRIGEPFNPWHQICGFYPPDLVARQHDLTDGQKRLYERSVRWAGQNGIFWHGFETMAEALGKSVRQAKSDMAALEKRGLIRHRRRRRQSNVYEFLWHAIFEVQRTTLQQGGLEVQDSTLEVQDDVSLEVQSTAREFSQLESCKLNSAKADQKRIPGHASQKPRSDASSLADPARIDKNETSKADSVHSAASVGCPSNYEEKSRKGWTQKELADVRCKITTFLGREPKEGFEIAVMHRARGQSAAAVCELLTRKFANKKLRPGGRYAPRSQNWFLTVIENEFSPGHLPECPSPPNPHELPTDSAVLNRGIEAIELPDAPRSIVESVVCSNCGGEALVAYTDGRVEGCGCRRSSPPGLKPAHETVIVRSLAGDDRRATA